MTYEFSPRIPGLNITVGSFLPRVRLLGPSGTKLAPVDMVEEDALAVCVYNPAEVNPFPIPPRGVDFPGRYAMLEERGVSLFVISGLPAQRLTSWMELVGADIHCLSDVDGEFTRQVGIPIKQVEGRNFRTHASFVLQEDRVLAILLETDPVVQFEQLLAALDIAEGREPGDYNLEDNPWYTDRQQYDDHSRAEEEDEDDEDDGIVEELDE